ncbi:hypothetical protein NDN08_002582 [Rhodosorus marinus]|uniref:Uncharacterized protein n=1 Tax=Rhodosorus marinus TaxID=101924 RepID=A0AAV8UY75_9RHOD|nr:hypothetical protein NDN08_002582 [Rhodosorus marinus]
MVGFVSGGWGLKSSGASVRVNKRRTVMVAQEMEAKSKMWGDGTDGSACVPADTDFAKKFESIRDAKVPTVTDTMAKFNETFARPVPSVYRSIVNEIITLNHLTTVCPMWHYDAVFGFGFTEILEKYFSFYPSAEEKEKLFSCIVGSLSGLDLQKMRDDAKAVEAFVAGKTEDEVLAMIESGSSEGPVLSAFQYIKESEFYDWYYSRNFGFGVIFIIEKLGGELTDANVERWARAIGASEVKVKDELGVYLSSLERLKQAEQMFADLAAREKKKAADQLAVDAKAALQEAEEAKKAVEN